MGEATFDTLTQVQGGLGLACCRGAEGAGDQTHFVMPLSGTVTQGEQELNFTHRFLLKLATKEAGEANSELG